MRDQAKNDIVLYSMIFQKFIGPDMFSCIRHYMVEVCALPSALLVHVNIVEARMRANTQNIQQGEQETRGVGERSTKQWRTEILGDLWKGEGWSREHRVYKMVTTWTFRKENREFDGGGFGVD